MSSLRVTKSFLKDVSPQDVIEERKTREYMDTTVKEMLACVKDTRAYKHMRDVAVMHMSSTLANPCLGLPGAEDREEKKKQIAEIGLLALQIDSSISEIISERIQTEAPRVIKRTLKRMSTKQTRATGSTNKRTKRKNVQPFGIENGLDDTDRISVDSVSSVHTSDLSSFDDEIVLSSEGEDDEKKDRISFKEVNKKYLKEGFSNIQDMVEYQHKLGNEVQRKTKSPEKSVESKIEHSTPVRPKRERKPNSKYS